ncbi:MAG: hypothetical protein HZB38_10295 [Planctomycetes bacterium]|nr:hypothetical protein [Planctomycetota bacterium]
MKTNESTIRRPGRARWMYTGGAGLALALAIGVGFMQPRSAFGVSAADPSATALHPRADGTIVDGSVYGAFDGVGDAADWAFANTGYQGAITKTTESPSNRMETRVVWEFDLASIAQDGRYRASLEFMLRGAPVYPMPDSVIAVYSYAADLYESRNDFSVGPAQLVGLVTLTPFQDPTSFKLDVSQAVRTALQSGARKVGFRFQIDPASTATTSQAFFDALDTDPNTKPLLVLRRLEAILPS